MLAKLRQKPTSYERDTNSLLWPPIFESAGFVTTANSVMALILIRSGREDLNLCPLVPNFDVR